MRGSSVCRCVPRGGDGGGGGGPKGRTGQKVGDGTAGIKSKYVNLEKKNCRRGI